MADEEAPATQSSGDIDPLEWRRWVTAEQVLDATEYLDKRHGEKKDVRLICVGRGLWFILVGTKPYGGVDGFTARVHAHLALTGHPEPDRVHPERRYYKKLASSVTP